jgi:uncharacterized protein (PEP-CTERM system associated)
MDTDMDTAMATDTGKNHPSKFMPNRPLPTAQRLIANGLVLLPALLGCGHAMAEREWRIEPTLTARAEVHNRSGAAAADGWLTELSPSLVLRYRIADTSASINYTPRLIFTDLSDPRSTIVHALNASAATQFASGRISLGANAAVGEQSIDPLSANSTSSVPDPNRARFYSLGVNGALRENLAPGIFGELRADYTYAGASAVSDALNALTNSPTSRWRVSGDVKPTSRNPEFGWLLGGEVSQSDGGTFQNSSSAYRAFVGALWNPTAQLSHDFRLGYERREFVAGGDNNKGVFAEASAHWRPSPLVDVRGSLGRHYYGTTGQLSAKVRGNRAALELSVGRQLVNSQESVFFPQTDSPLVLLDRFLSGTISDPVARAVEAQRLANVFGLPSQISTPSNFYLDRFVLEQSARASGIYTLPRISFNGSASYRKTDPGASQISSISLQSVSPTIELQSSVGASYRLSELSTLRFDLQGSRSERLDTSERRNRFRSQVTFSQIWSKAITTGATVFYERERGDTVVNNFTDRGLGVFVRYTFN